MHLASLPQSSHLMGICECLIYHHWRIFRYRVSLNTDWRIYAWLWFDRIAPISYNYRNRTSSIEKIMLIIKSQNVYWVCYDKKKFTLCRNMYVLFVETINSSGMNKEVLGNFFCVKCKNVFKCVKTNEIVVVLTCCETGVRSYQL